MITTHATLPVLALVLLVAVPASAAPLTITGADLLTAAEASFPSTQPKLDGTSLIFEWGTSHGPPDLNLVRYQVNPSATLPPSGDVAISAVWNVARLPCNGFCAGGPSGITDWDPYFALSDGTNVVGFVLGDDNGGQVVAESAVDGGPYSDGRAIFLWEKGTGFPEIGDSLAVRLDFTLHDTGATARVRYLGVDESWTFANTLTRSSGLALLLAQDNDSGERYQVNSLQFPAAAAIPEPTTLALVGAALLASRHPQTQAGAPDLTL